MAACIEFELARYTGMTITPPEVIQDITQAAHEAYLTFVDTVGGRARNLTYEDVKGFGACIFTSDYITRYLGGLRKGYKTGFLNAYFPPKDSFHALSTVQAASLPPEGIVVDATWQQFLPQRPWWERKKDIIRAAPFPEVLIGTEAEIAKVALGFGFTTEQASTWGPVEARSVVPRG